MHRQEFRRDSRVLFAEPAFFTLFLVERLHEPHTGHRVGQDCRQARPLASASQEDPVDSASEPAQRPEDERQWQQHQQAQPPVSQQEHDPQAHEHG